MNEPVKQFIKWVSQYPSFVNINGYKFLLENKSNKILSNCHKRNIDNLMYKILARARPFIDVAKMDGLLYCRLNGDAFDLIGDIVKFQLPKIDSNNIPMNAHPVRKTAISEILSSKFFDPSLRSRNQENFDQYLYDIKDKYICFTRFYPKMVPTPALVLPYKTRFTSKKATMKTLLKYENAIKLATQDHSDGVFLTLTTDPKKFDSIWQANRHFSKAWNKFLSYITKKHGIRPRYVATYEYTKRTGLLHMHVIIFGLSWLAPHKEITKEWDRCGQGTINHEYVIHYAKRRWQWTKARPDRCVDKDPTYYLKKYLIKGIYDNHDYDLFWLFNKRFMTCSRVFLEPAPIPPPKVVLWKYIGTWDLYNVPDILFDNSNAINYFMEVPKT